MQALRSDMPMNQLPQGLNVSHCRALSPFKSCRYAEHHSLKRGQECRLRPCPLAKAKKGEHGEDDENLERLLWKELQKRGFSSPEQLGTKSQSQQQRPDPAPRFAKESSRSQLEESRKLNSEGLEGLIPRGRQLLSLGTTFFLAFWPFLIAISALFTGIFWLYGEDFIHGGRPSYTKYVEPIELLNERTVDERVPFR